MRKANSKFSYCYYAQTTFVASRNSGNECHDSRVHSSSVWVGGSAHIDLILIPVELDGV